MRPKERKKNKDMIERDRVRLEEHKITQNTCCGLPGTKKVTATVSHFGSREEISSLNAEWDVVLVTVTVSRTKANPGDFICCECKNSPDEG